MLPETLNFRTYASKYIIDFYDITLFSLYHTGFSFTSRIQTLNTVVDWSMLTVLQYIIL